MRSVIITGANGFVGSALVRAWLADGAEVWAIVHHHEDRLPRAEKLHIVRCDMRDYSRLPWEIGAKPEAFYHLAWEGSSGPGRGDEGLQLENVYSTCAAVRAAVALGCKRFIFAASVMQYELTAALQERQTPGINSLYSAAKQSADIMARILAENNGMRYISALISNIYGPGERSPRLINSSIRRLLRAERLSLSPGEQLYDFIYITDAAKMLVLLGREDLSGGAYYIGNPHPKPLKQFMMALRDIVAPGAPLGLGDLPYRDKGLTYREFDPCALYHEVDFRPEIPFEEGIRKTRDWIIEEDGIHESVHV